MKPPICKKCGTPKVSTEYSEICKRLFGKDMCPKCDFVMVSKQKINDKQSIDDELLQ